MVQRPAPSVQSNPARCELHFSSVPARCDRTIVSAHRSAAEPPPVPSGRSVAPADARQGEAATPGASGAARAGGHLPAGPGPAQGKHAGARVLHGDQAQVQAGHPFARHAARPAAGAACLEGNSCGAGSRHNGAWSACFSACGVVALGGGARAGLATQAVLGPLYSRRASSRPAANMRYKNLALSPVCEHDCYVQGRLCPHRPYQVALLEKCAEAVVAGHLVVAMAQIRQ